MEIELKSMSYHARMGVPSHLSSVLEEVIESTVVDDAEAITSRM